MTLKKYGQLLDKVIPFEAKYICADEKYMYLFRRRPRCIEITPTRHVWKGEKGNNPLLIMRRDMELTFPDVEQYRDLTGIVDYMLCIEKIE
jgi:hypothetical protein